MSRQISAETSMTRKQLCKKLDRDLVEYRPTLNIFSLGRFMRAHRHETFFYGCRRDGDRVMIFHHAAKKRDGGSSGFFGTIEQTDSGSRLVGKIRKPVSTYVFAVLLSVVSLLLVLMSAGLREFTAMGVFAGIWTVSLFLILYDNKKKFITAYLDALKDDQSMKRGK